MESMTVYGTISPPLSHRQSMTLAADEFSRMLALLKQLSAEDWAQPTVCDLWDVRTMASHVLAMAESQASVRQFAHDFRAAGRRSGGKMIDAMTAAQVQERSALAADEIIDRLTAVAPKAVTARRRIPAPVRWGVRMKQDPPFDAERWKFGYLVDTIFTRDTWMHRLDITRASGLPMLLTPDHDGLLIDGVVSEWARRHGQPFRLSLSGEAGGTWEVGQRGEQLQLDALDFCWLVGSREKGSGLLATEVPF
jgi:uncharacterized protein (TIGR03083 family)